MKNSGFGFAMVDAARASAVEGWGGGGWGGREGTVLMNEQDSGPELEGLVQVSTVLFPA